MILGHKNDGNTSEMRCERIGCTFCCSAALHDVSLYDDDGKTNALFLNDCAFKCHGFWGGATKPPQRSGSSRSVFAWINEVIRLTGFRCRWQRFSLHRGSFAPGMPAARADDLILARGWCRRAGLQSRSGFIGHIRLLGAAFAVRHERGS